MGQLSKIFVIAKYTAKEVLQSKILLNVLLLGIGLLAVTFVAFNFTYGTPARVALDFGLGTLSLSAVGIAIFMGISLLSDEIDSRTVYMILSRPIKRSSFIVGKILGLSFVVFINTLLLSFLTLGIFLLSGGELSSLIHASIVFIFLEALLVLTLVCFLSLITSKVLTVLISLAIYIAGHSITGAKLTTMVQQSPVLSHILDAYHFVLPGFYKLNLKNFVLYEQTIDPSYIAINFLYAICYIVFLVFISIFIFNRKNLD